MTYAVVIVREDGTKDFKAFTQSADAIKRYNSAFHYVYSGDLARRKQGLFPVKYSEQILRMPERRLTSSKKGRRKYYHPEVHYRRRDDAPSIDEL